MDRSCAATLMSCVVALACGAGVAPDRGQDIEIERAAIDPAPTACGRCHAEIVQAWAQSMHAHAWDDPVFRSEYDVRPDASCRDCHAPPTSAPGRSTGIDCATCHLRDGVILAVRTTEAGMKAHPMRPAPELGTPEHCGECHQFTFLDDGVHDPAEALQNTLVEFYGSDAYARGQTCQSCHMPGGSHALRGIHEPEMLARALDVEVRAHRSGSRIEVAMTFSGADIGHAFPTGDVFRRAEFRVHTPGGAAAQMQLQRWLARTTDPDGEELHVRTVDDTRVPAPGQGVAQESLSLEDGDATSVTWELVLHRLPPARAAEAKLGPDVVTRTVTRGETIVTGAP